MLLFLLSPVLIAIAVAIRLDSSGPVIYTQQRVGSRRRRRNGRLVWEICTFRFLKFRSMLCNADDRLHQEHIREYCSGRGATACGGGTSFKLANDPRVTTVGRFLRKTSLDELPQLVNVLRGEMSLVGPRPVPLYEVAHYKDAHWERLATLPGITGLWQVYGRCVVPFEEMVRMDIHYARHCSLWLDLKILALTLPAVLAGRGAE